MKKISALITASGGIGSHYVLHRMHGHPNIVSLNELSFRTMGGTTKGDLKRYLSSGALDLEKIYQEQLHPFKDIDHNVDWLILNKPPLKMINYHRTFHPDIPINYIFRNPVSFYYTWVKKWGEYGNKRYNKKISDSQVFEWFRVTFMSSLFELAQNFDPERDNIVSFEHFFNNTDGELERIFNCLDVPVLKTEELKVMDKCNICYSEKVVKREMNIREGRENEEVLFCHRHGPVLGPGEHNYIRKEDGSFINKWKKKDDHLDMCKKFSSLFGGDIIEYFLQEEYITDIDRSKFDDIMLKFLRELKRE